jgi:HSP20 family molecular chaperone IbpA
MTTLRRTTATLPAVAMRSVGDFDIMWREMAQTNKRVWTIAHEPLPDLFSMWEPCIDLVEQDDAYVLRAELPGMQRDDMTIEYSDGILTVRGEQTIETAADHAVRRMKHGYHAFARRFVLPEPVEVDAMVTTYAHGVLEVHLPRVLEVLDQPSPVQVAS